MTPTSVGHRGLDSGLRGKAAWPNGTTGVQGRCRFAPLTPGAAVPRALPSTLNVMQQRNIQPGFHCIQGNIRLYPYISYLIRFHNLSGATPCKRQPQISVPGLAIKTNEPNQSLSVLLV